MPPIEQLTLDFSEPACFDDLLRSLNIDNLKVTSSRRLKNGWRVIRHGASNRRTLVIPSFFDDAPAEIKKALIHWAMLPLCCRAPSENYRKRKALEQTIRRYLKDHHQSLKRVSRLSTNQTDYVSAGLLYDLRQVFSDLNQRYFDNQLRAIVRWGTPRSRLSYQSTRQNREGNPFYIITIGGIYNISGIPLFAIESIMFHEMLHIKYPPQKKNGRNTIHHGAFMEAERAFPHFLRWRSWEKHDLPHLYQRASRKKKWWHAIFS